ncbi:tetratricopeptide repeat protein [Sneathiella limimaris]|uniref:tetratricopeptide repeat protein n=1 Tax=Sneathiella limimaris TaxID=1964213 RepID=UPI00146F7E5E|nr:RHS repeat domain-containing protein [Sneathiella limimaris]
MRLVILILTRVLIAVCIFVHIAAITSPLSANEARQNLFEMPEVSSHMQRAIAALKVRNIGLAQNTLEGIAKKYPWYVEAHYILATLYTAQNKPDQAITSLNKAVEAGFTNHQLLYKDNNLKPLRDRPDFQSLAEGLIQKSATGQTSSETEIKVFPVRGDTALISTDNTHWDGKLLTLRSYFKFNDRRAANSTVQNIKDPIASQLNSLFQRGLAAGNTGDIYDNRDHRHSSLHKKQYPQLTFSAYSEKAKAQQLDYGLNTKILFNSPTIGNSSTAITGGPFWRSQARLSYTIPNGPQHLFLQYLNNHIYVFPSVRDYDYQEGKQDYLPTNTPYLIISKGKSGSDRPFLRAVATILAAFKPDDKDELIKTNRLASAVQTVFRKGLKSVQSDADYFTSKAHKVVYEKSDIDLLKMIKIANDFDASTFPAPVQMRVIEESKLKPGIDDFTRALPEQLFNSPSTIARIVRGTAYEKTMSLEVRSVTPGIAEDITYKWVLLQGDPKKVSIKPLTASGNKVEIRSKWQKPFKLSHDPEVTSSRVEIAVFATTKNNVSAPSFLTLLYPRNENREYNAQGRLLSLDHRPTGKTYVDPQIFSKRNWKDEYRYDAKGRLIGWTRTKGTKVSEFTYHGALVLEKDSQGRATRAQRVAYEYSRASNGQTEAQEKLLNAYLNYEYVNDTDQRGIITKKE